MEIDTLVAGMCAVVRCGFALGRVWNFVASSSTSTLSFASADNLSYVSFVSWWLLIHCGLIGRRSSWCSSCGWLIDGCCCQVRRKWEIIGCWLRVLIFKCWWIDGSPPFGAVSDIVACEIALPDSILCPCDLLLARPTMSRVQPVDLVVDFLRSSGCMCWSDLWPCRTMLWLGDEALPTSLYWVVGWECTWKEIRSSWCIGRVFQWAWCRLCLSVRSGCCVGRGNPLTRWSMLGWDMICEWTGFREAERQVFLIHVAYIWCWGWSVFLLRCPNILHPGDTSFVRSQFRCIDQEDQYLPASWLIHGQKQLGLCLRISSCSWSLILGRSFELKTELLRQPPLHEVQRSFLECMLCNGRYKYRERTGFGERCWMAKVSALVLRTWIYFEKSPRMNKDAENATGHVCIDASDVGFCGLVGFNCQC